jgi:hypothetical protein
MRARPGRLAVCLVAVAWFVVAWTPPALAGPTVEESFTPSFPIYANGGLGFSGPWTQGGFNAFASGYTPRDRSLCYRGLHGAGGSVSGHAFPAINGAIRNLAQPLGADGTTVFVSFLVQPQGVLGDGVFGGFFGLTLNGSLGNDLFIGKPGAGALEQYVLENRGGAGQITSGVPTVVGDTTLLVLKAQFLAGNDVFTLYVNPALNRPEPAGGVVKADLNLGTVSRIGIYSTGAFTVDEIRIGATFADVVPADDHTPDPDFPGCLEERR